MKIIKKGCRRPEFAFEMSLEAAEKDFYALTKYGMNLDKAINAHKDTPLDYGSKFRSAEHLKSISGRHPVRPRMKNILQNGSNWPLEEVGDKTKALDIKEALTFGNRKGENQQPDLLRKLVKKM